MGNLINPISSRLGYVKYWNSTWATNNLTNYSSGIFRDTQLSSYVPRLISSVNRRFNENLVNILSYKVLKKNDTHHFLFYLRLQVDDGIFYNSLLKILQERFKKVEAYKALYFFKSSALINKIKNKRAADLRKNRNVKRNKNSLPGNNYNNTNKKRNDNNIWNATTTIFKKLESDTLNKSNKDEILSRSQQVIRYDTFRRYSFPEVLLIKNANALKNLFEKSHELFLLSPKKFGGVKTKNKEIAVYLATVLTRYALYKAYLFFIKKFITASVQKLLSVSRNIKCAFIRVNKNALTAETLTRYVAARLKEGTPLRSVVRLFLRQMRLQSFNASILGFKLVCSGRFERRGRATYIWKSLGKVPNTNFELRLDYSLRLVVLTNSICAIKIWVVKPIQEKKYYII